MGGFRLAESVIAVPHECDASRVVAERGSEAPPSELLAHTYGDVQV
jgi:hypothetical protein